jgi:hypothetical protein
MGTWVRSYALVGALVAACGGRTDDNGPASTGDAASDAPTSDGATVACGPLTCTAPTICVVTLVSVGPQHPPDDAGLCSDGTVPMHLVPDYCASPVYACATLPLPDAAAAPYWRCSGPPSCDYPPSAACGGPCEVSPGAYECDCILD